MLDVSKVLQGYFDEAEVSIIKKRLEEVQNNEMYAIAKKAMDFITSIVPGVIAGAVAGVIR